MSLQIVVTVLKNKCWMRAVIFQIVFRNESGFRPPLCTYRLNWARRTSWGWWDDWDDTGLQTHDSKFEPWWSEAKHATSRSRRLPTILTFTREWGRNIFRFFQTAETGNRTPNSGMKGSGANHYPRASGEILRKLKKVGLILAKFLLSHIKNVHLGSHIKLLFRHNVNFGQAGGGIVVLKFQLFYTFIVSHFLLSFKVRKLVHFPPFLPFFKRWQ